MKTYIHMTATGIPVSPEHSLAYVHEKNIYQIKVGQYLLIDGEGKAYLPIQDKKDDKKFYVDKALPDDLKWVYVDFKASGHSLKELKFKGNPKEMSIKEILQAFNLIETENLEAVLLAKLEHLLEKNK